MLDTWDVSGAILKHRIRDSRDRSTLGYTRKLSHTLLLYTCIFQLFYKVSLFQIHVMGSL